MSKSICVVLLKKRSDAALNVQKILTGWGCTIKTRLGIHDGVMDNCSDEGLILLELVGAPEQNEELTRKLNVLDNVSARLVDISVD